jgi:hypothetical protein
MDLIGFTIAGFFVMAVPGHFGFFRNHKIPSFRYILLRTATHGKREEKYNDQPEPYIFSGLHTCRIRQPYQIQYDYYTFFSGEGLRELIYDLRFTI